MLYIYYVRLRVMKDILERKDMKITERQFQRIQALTKEIHSTSFKVMKKWESEDGLNLDKGQDAVMVLIKEYMNVQDPSIGQMKECLNGLQMILKG